MADVDIRGNRCDIAADLSWYFVHRATTGITISVGLRKERLDGVRREKDGKGVPRQ